MAISWHQPSRTFYLDGKDLSYVFFINHAGYAEHLYLGPKIPHDLLLYTRRAGPGSAAATAPGRDDQGKNPICSYQECPPELAFFGTGDYREPAVHFVMPEGDRLAELLYRGHEILPQKPAIPGMPSLSGGETLVLHLADPKGKVEADLYYTVYDDSNVIARRAVYRNAGSRPVTLDRAYSFSMGLTGHDYEALTLFGTWAGERQIDRTPLHHGVFSVDSKRTSSSATLNPFMALVSPHTTEEAGEAVGISLVYSSSYVLKAEVEPNGTTVVTGGVNDFDFAWRLESGEEFYTPEVVIAYSSEGLGGMSRAYHDAFRKHLICPKYVKTPRPLLINNWEATYFDFTFEKLKAIVDAVAGTGIDTFVLDDGWFGKRDDDHSGLGDWVPNTRKLDLSAIIDYTHSKGLKFGLWFEPEMVCEDSDLFRAHPDYAIGRADRGRCYARHQFMLDLTRAEVREAIAGAVNRILDTYPIEYVKWDYNRNVTDSYSAELPPERQAEFAHRYALGLYDLCERIVSAHPDIFFEGCASGGARFDPAMLYYFPQIWTSDNTDAEDRTFIQWGTSMVYPPSVMSCHVSVCPNHQTGRTVSFDTRADIAHLGATGYELDTSAWTEEDKAAVRAQTAAYREMQDLVLDGDFWRVGDIRDNVFAFLMADKNKSRAHMVCYRRLGRPSNEIVRLKVPGLDPAKKYYVKELGLILSGRTLSAVGVVPDFPKGDFRTVVYTIEEK